jgi:hypothetical protein
MPDVWRDSFADIPDLYGVAAVKELCASRDWPPSVNQIREMALCLAEGDVVPPSPWEAWERALDGRSATPIEKRTLKLIGGRWEIDHTENQGVTRSNFVKAYAELVEHDRRRRLALPSVKALAASNRKKLEETPVERQIEEKPRHRATPEEVLEIMKGYKFKYDSRSGEWTER